MNGIRDIFKRFLPYFKDYVPQFSLAILGMIMAAAGSAISAYLVKPVLDKIFVEKNEDMLYILPYAIIAIYFIKSLGTYMQAYYTAYIGQDTVRRFREKLLGNLLKLDMEFFSQHRVGELVSRNINDIERIRSVVSSMIPEFIREVITIIGLLCVVLYQSLELSFFALIIMPLAVFPISKLAKKMRKISRSSQEKTSDISSCLNEIFTNIEIIKSKNAQDYELNRFSKENDKFFKLNLKSVKIGEIVSPIMETLGSIGISIVIIFGGKEVIDGTLSVGSFFSFLTALFMLYTPLKRISKLHNSMQDAIAASERTFELIDKHPNILSGKEEFPQDINTISFNNVYLKYKDKVVLNGVNLIVKKGELIAIVGKSGGGKTSIINLLMRFYDPIKGDILVNDQNIAEFDIKSLRKNIGFVSQRAYILNDTVAKNVCYGNDFDKQKVIDALKMANALEFVNNLENGIETILNEFGTNLSGGQRQRITIARALYDNPQILIFDEATSALDNESEKVITNIIRNLSNNKIIFVIAHRMSTVEDADKIAVVSNGKIVAFGNDKELSNSCEIYKNLKGTIITDKEN